jgi:O-acetyl-ADP-ribose deacetylase (regulator of RNase III)
MAEQGTASGFYTGTFPAVAAGVYAVSVKRQAGGSPAETDATVGFGPVEWSGTAVVPLSSRLAPTTAGRTLTVSTGGAARLDWASIESASTAVTLTNTNVRQVTQVATGAITSGSYATSALDAISAAVRDVSNAAPAASSLGAAVNAVKAKTDSLTFTTGGKVDAKLTSDGLDNISATAPTALATTFREKV